MKNPENFRIELRATPTIKENTLPVLSYLNNFNIGGDHLQKVFSKLNVH